MSNIVSSFFQNQDDIIEWTAHLKKAIYVSRMKEKLSNCELRKTQNSIEMKTKG